MKLEFLYAPTRDLQVSLALYRDELGWEEAWREGDSTVSLKLPGSDVQLMLDATDGAGPSARCSCSTTSGASVPNGRAGYV